MVHACAGGWEGVTCTVQPVGSAWRGRREQRELLAGTWRPAPVEDRPWPVASAFDYGALVPRLLEETGLGAALVES